MGDRNRVDMVRLGIVGNRRLPDWVVMGGLGIFRKTQGGLPRLKILGHLTSRQFF